MNTELNETQENAGAAQVQPPKKKGKTGHIIFWRPAAWWPAWG